MLKQYLSTSAVSVVGLALALLVNVFLARIVSADQFGLFLFAISMTHLLSIIVSGGLPLLLTREIAGALHEGNDVGMRQISSAAILWVLISSAGIILSVYVVLLVFSSSSAGLLLLASAILPAIGFSAMGNGILKGIGKPAIAEASNRIVLPVAMLLGAAWIWRFGDATASALIFLQMIAYVFTAVVSLGLVRAFLSAKFSLSRPGPRQLEFWGKSLVSFTMISGISVFGSQISILVLGLLHQPEQVAFFRVAERGAQLVNLPLLFINSVLGPPIVRAIRDGRNGDLQRLTRSAARMSIAMSAPVAFGMIAFGKPLISWTFGASYVDQSYLPLVILCGAQLISVMLGSVGLLLMLTGHEKLHVTIQLLAVLVTTIALALLVERFHAFGAASAVAIGLVFLNLSLALVVRRKLGFLPSIF